MLRCAGKIIRPQQKQPQRMHQHADIPDGGRIFLARLLAEHQQMIRDEPCAQRGGNQRGKVYALLHGIVRRQRPLRGCQHNAQRHAPAPHEPHGHCQEKRSGQHRQEKGGVMQHAPAKHLQHRGAKEEAAHRYKQPRRPDHAFSPPFSSISCTWLPRRRKSSMCS